MPAARSGKLDLVDPETLKIPFQSIGGFSPMRATTAATTGVTSVDAGGGRLFATDRTSHKLQAIDLKTRALVVSAALAAGPDYVRFVAPAESG